MAMIVNSGTTIDPVTGREVKGKEMMMHEYDHQKNRRIKNILKNRSKSGFHQVAINEESIPWTAFLVPEGLYEWLVMPFGLKNAPTVFQRKMDKQWPGLISNKNEDSSLNSRFPGSSHRRRNYKAATTYHKKIVNFNEEELKTKKGLRSFLGILNYARNHIPKLRIFLRSLYEKTNIHGDKRLKPSNYKLVRKIKEHVQNLPDVEIPPKNAYIILETDGCKEGYGGIVKWKKSKGDPRSS
ncbi:hypothetical protein Tco_1166981 [Tanacetum coccineum]